MMVESDCSPSELRLRLSSNTLEWRLDSDAFVNRHGRALDVEETDETGCPKGKLASAWMVQILSNQQLTPEPGQSIEPAAAVEA